MKRLLLLISLCLAATAQAQERELFDNDWLFTLVPEEKNAKAKFGNPAETKYNDSKWRKLNVPHDWAVEGDFLPSNPSGASGGALPGGIGWYRKHFSVKANRSGDNTDRYFIDFDGVFMNSTVYVNGHALGTRPYGYSSFRYDMTPYINLNGENVIAVKVDNSDQPNSRWYSGCGIYRHVWLVRKNQLHIAHWGIFVNTTAQNNGKKAQLAIQVKVEGQSPDAANFDVVNTVYDATGKEVAKVKQTLSGKSREVKVSETTAKLSNPKLWSVDSPYLYNVKTEIKQGGTVLDECVTTTGVRYFNFDAKKGFSLNGKSMKINGVCQHHDLGCLGSAINEDALVRQLTMLKDMGCNAIRCSHNPPAPELLDLCDKMGFLVMDECFDMWRRRKTQNDYARFFDEWANRDLTDLVVRDRNHPSIIMWSIGNEVLEQWSDASADTLSLEQANMILNAGHDASTLAKDGEMSINSILAKNLSDIIKNNDQGTGRLITAGCNEPDPNNHLFKSGGMDLIGFNYHHQWVRDVPKNFPGKPFIFSESVSALQTTGFYSMPSDKVSRAPKEWWMAYADPSYKCSAYDNMHAPWSSTHEATWDVVKHNDFVCGQFIWTGWDYIGEPTPYSYPAHSSYFGIIDLAGFPKDSYYLYQSEWTDKDVLHLFPHWNWVEGQDIDLWCYYNNADEVELFINGKSQGTRKKTDNRPALKPEHTSRDIYKGSGNFDGSILNTPYHVGWRVKYTPGEVKVVAKKDGKAVREQVIKTAASPYSIRLTSNRQTLKADGTSMAFVTVEVVDKDGNLCPLAEDQIFFDVKGGAKIAGVDNGSQYTLERFKDDKRKAFFGKCLVVLQNDGSSTPVTLTAKSPMLKPASLTIGY